MQGGIISVGKNTADTGGGAAIGAAIGAMMGGPLGALIGGGIGGLIGGKKIVDGTVSYLEYAAGKLAKDKRVTTEQRKKFAELHDRAKEIREYREQHK